MREIWKHTCGMVLLRTKHDYFRVLVKGNGLYDVGHTGNWSVEYYPSKWKRIGFNYYLEKL